MKLLAVEELFALTDEMRLSPDLPSKEHSILPHPWARVGRVCVKPISRKTPRTTCVSGVFPLHLLAQPHRFGLFVHIHIAQDNDFRLVFTQLRNDPLKYALPLPCTLPDGQMHSHHHERSRGHIAFTEIHAHGHARLRGAKLQALTFHIVAAAYIDMHEPAVRRRFCCSR
jgi:hypothetical protein